MIVKAKIKMDLEIIKEIIPMIDGLGDSFQEAERIVHKNNLKSDLLLSKSDY